MASPFRLFRKYQKAFLAVAAVLAMVIFVFADLLTGALGPSSGGGKNPTIATWDGGSMTAFELDSLSQRRVFISQFLTQLLQTGAMKLMDAGGTPLQPSVPQFILREGLTQKELASDCIRTRIFAEQAKEAGIQISDTQVNNYLKEISFGQVGGSEILEMLGPSPGKQEKRLMSGLRELLLSDAYFSSFSNAAQTVTPEERWQDWRSINKRISVEAAVLPVARFVSKVEEPSESELSEFYEEYKDFFTDGQQMVMGKRLPSRNPGFREPRRVRIQYLLGDVASKSIELVDSITEEEISEFYERNKRPMFIKQSQEESEGPSESANDAAEDTGDIGSETTNDETTDPAVESQEDSETESDANSTSEAEVEVDEVTESTESVKATDETPVADEPASEAPVSPQPEGEESGNYKRSSPFRLVANENETEDTSADDAGETTSESEDDDVQFIPLSEVRDRIRQTIATRKAVESLQPIVDKALAKLEKEFRPYSLDVADAEDNKTEIPAPPKSLTDLAALAKETGLVHEKTSLLTGQELSDTYVGKARDVINQQISVTAAAFGDLSLYEPFLAKDLDGNFYIAVKMEDVASRIPELEEIREQVVDAWKMKEAAKLAIKTAEEYAKSIQESGENYEIFFSNKPYEVVTTDSFSWLTFGSIPLEYGPRAPELGEAPPLESVGTDFMVKAFELKDKDVAATLNHDETYALVIRLDSQEQTDEQLRKQFLAEANTSISGYILNQVRTQANLRGLRTEIVNRINLDTEKLDDYFSKN